MPQKYKNLRGGVSSFTEGFTGILNEGFRSLGSYAVAKNIADFQFDLLSRKSEPAITEPWFEHLISYKDPQERLPRVGVATEHVSQFSITIHFHLSTLETRDYGSSTERSMRFDSDIKIVDDRNHVYEFHHQGNAYFR